MKKILASFIAAFALMSFSQPVAVQALSGLPIDGTLSINKPTVGYVKDGVIKVEIEYSPTQAKALGADVTQIYLVLKNSGKVIGEFTTPRANVEGTSSQFFNGVAITSTNGFKDGSNTLTLEMYQAGTSTVLASASSTIAVTGFGAAPTGTGGVGGTGGVPSPTPTTTGTGGVGGTGGVAPTVGSGVIATIQNPIPFNSLGELLVAAIRFILTMLGALAVFFIIVGAVKMVTSQGNEKNITSGKQTIQWAVIGLIVALMSFSVIALVQSFLQRQ